MTGESVTALHRYSASARTIHSKGELTQSVTQINVIAIKREKLDEFIEAQKRDIASIDLPPGLIGFRMYKSTDGKSAVLVAQYESIKALEEVQQRAVLKQHIEKVRPLVESSSPAL